MGLHLLSKELVFVGPLHGIIEIIDTMHTVAPLNVGGVDHGKGRIGAGSRPRKAGNQPISKAVHGSSSSEFHAQGPALGSCPLYSFRPLTGLLPIPAKTATFPADSSDQASIACRSASVDVISILRGLAFSATGILKDSTPAS